MPQLNNFEIIKEYILNDEERFAVAVDIFNNFVAIRSGILEEILSFLQKEISKQDPPIRISTSWDDTYVGEHFCLIKIEKKEFQFNFGKYFDQSVHFYLKSELVTDDERKRALTGKIEHLTVDDKGNVSVNKLDDYKFNKANDYMGLYRLYKKEDIKEELLENFRNSILPRLQEICKILDG